MSALCRIRLFEIYRRKCLLGVVNEQASEDGVVTMKMKLNSEAERQTNGASTDGRLSGGRDRHVKARSTFLFRFESDQLDGKRGCPVAVQVVLLLSRI